jgi:hypothetical protein
MLSIDAAPVPYAVSVKNTVTKATTAQMLTYLSAFAAVTMVTRNTCAVIVLVTAHSMNAPLTVATAVKTVIAA